MRLILFLLQKYKIHIISGKIFSENRDLFSEKTFGRKNQTTYIGTSANAYPNFDLPFLQFFFILILHLFKNYL